MSIYCSIFDFGHEHKPRCKRMRKLRAGVYERDDSIPCTCGDSPIRYQGSHVLPSAKDERGGIFGIAAIPNHITRDGRDDRPENGKWYPWLRVSLDEAPKSAVILTRAQVKELRDSLNHWLQKSSERGKADMSKRGQAERRKP